MIELAYDAFLLQQDHNLETAGPSEDLAAAVQAGDMDAVMAAVRVMCRDAGSKAKLLWTGSPVGTTLRNDQLKATASRAITPDGLPLWNISTDIGEKWDSHEPVLTPEEDWRCILDPTKSNEQEQQP